MFDGVMKLRINGTKTGRVLHPSPVILAGKTARPGLLKAFVFYKSSSSPQQCWYSGGNEKKSF